MTTSAQVTTPAAAAHDSGHALPLKVYFGVYGALLVLTALTVGVSIANLGPAAIYVALAVAVVKASLVASYFMHLKFDSRLNLLVFVASLFFLGLFFAITFTDLGTRDAVVEAEGTFVLRQEEAAASAARPAGSAPSAASPAPSAGSAAPTPPASAP